jgi:hypothetical protein
MLLHESSTLRLVILLPLALNHHMTVLAIHNSLGSLELAAAKEPVRLARLQVFNRRFHFVAALVAASLVRVFARLVRDVDAVLTVVEKVI